ncbi:unnamed protein product [Rhodiola kirilowii]
MIVTGTSTKEINDFKQEMMKAFEMSDLGLLSYYLGIEVEQKDGFIALKQSAYAKKILEQSGMMECNSNKVPMEPKLKIGKDENGVPANATEYRKAVKQILRYLKGSLNFGLKYKKGEDEVLIGYSDSNLAEDIDDRRSTTEFMAATSAACQAVWLRRLLTDLTGNKAKEVNLYVDNKSAIALMKNPVFHRRSKHIDTRFHFIRECVEKGDIIISHVCTDEQKADILTKALAKVKFLQMRKMLGVADLNQV